MAHVCVVSVSNVLALGHLVFVDRGWDSFGSRNHHVEFADHYLNIVLCAAFDLLLRLPDFTLHNVNRARRYSLSPLHHVNCDKSILPAKFPLHCVQLLLKDEEGQIGTHLSNGVISTSKRNLLAGCSTIQC